MQKIRQYWERFLKITGAIFTIRELLIIFGVPGCMVTVSAAAIAQFLSGMPWGYRIPLLVFIFMLVFAGIRYFILYRKKRVIPNKHELIKAIADYETKARNAFLAKGQGYANQYLNASEFWSQEHLKSGLSKCIDNPITQMVIFAGFHVSLRHGGIVEISPQKSLRLDKYSFIGRLRSKAEKAIEWVNAIAR